MHLLLWRMMLLRWIWSIKVKSYILCVNKLILMQKDNNKWQQKRNQLLKRLYKSHNWKKKHLQDQSILCKEIDAGLPLHLPHLLHHLHLEDHPEGEERDRVPTLHHLHLEDHPEREERDRFPVRVHQARAVQGRDRDVGTIIPRKHTWKDKKK